MSVLRQRHGVPVAVAPGQQQQQQHPPPTSLPLPVHTLPVPSISEISSQSSDEDVAGRHSRSRRGGGGASTDGRVPSSLMQSHSASLREQVLTQSESSSSETNTDCAMVPDKERLKQYYLDKANKTTAKVPKIPSRIKKEMVYNYICCTNN